MAPLPPSFYDRDALDVAHDLLGCEIGHAGVRLRITEVEAYRYPGDTALLTGPGKVGAALALDTSLSGTPLGEPIAVYPRAAPPGRVLVGPRVGIDYAEPGDREAPWRVAVSNSRWVSHRKGLRPHP